MLSDMLYYLPDDILCKVDRASMFNSLETRQPFLDERIVTEAFKIPYKYKVHGNSGKIILKKILSQNIPLKFFNKLKSGFAMPIDYWLRESLRDWCNDLLEYNFIKQQGFFNPDIVKHIKDSHLSGKMNYQNEIWSILMFQNWYLNK